MKNIGGIKVPITDEEIAAVKQRIRDNGMEQRALILEASNLQLALDLSKINGGNV